MSDPLLDAIAAVSDKSPAIKRALGLAAQRIIALEAVVTPPPPPPPPPPPASGKPFTLFRYGASFNQGTPSTYGQHYANVVVGYGDDNKGATVAPARLLDYRTSLELTDSTDAGASLAGVTLAEATQFGWALRDSSGSLIYDPKWMTHYGDVGNAAYSARWCANVGARMQTYNLPGLFLDNVTALRGDFGGVANATAWSSDAAFEDAVAAHIGRMRAALPGAFLMANAGRARDRVAWWKRLAALGVNALVVESFDGSDAHIALIQAAQNAGAEAWALVYGDPASAAVRALAVKFASVTNGRGGFAVNSSGPDPWNENWTKAIVP